MIKTPLSTVIGGAFWTPSCTVIGGQQSFSQLIKNLFSNGEQGFFYDPNDLSTMFQDAAGTVPVTVVGQPVGLIRDKSGRNNHARQTTSASRPILRKNAVTGTNYLEFDGSDDFLQTANIDFTATDKVSLFAGLWKMSDAATGIVAELSTDSVAVNSSFGLFAPAGRGATKFQFVSRGMVTNYSMTTDPAYIAPFSSVLRAVGDISTQRSNIYVNSVFAAGASTGSNPTVKYGNHPLYIGRRAGTFLPFNGHLYSLIGIGRLTTDSETVAIEKELAKRVGVTLNV